jgi:hypothetical protein
MNLALNLLQKLFPRTGELTPFGECWFGSLLLDFERYHEAVEHFENKKQFATRAKKSFQTKT